MSNPTGKKRRWPWVLAAVIAVFAIIGAVSGQGDDKDEASTSTQEATEEMASPTPEADPTSGEPEESEPPKVTDSDEYQNSYSAMLETLINGYTDDTADHVCAQMDNFEDGFDYKSFIRGRMEDAGISNYEDATYGDYNFDAAEDALYDWC